MAIGSTLLKFGLPAAVTAGANIFSRPTSQQRTFLNQLGQLQTGAAESAGQLRTAGTGLVSAGQETSRAPIDYWSKILRGDRGTVLSAVAPEVRQIETGYEGAKRGLEMMPRGGGRSALMSQLPFEQQRDVSTLIQGARPAAASALLGAGQQQQQTGANLLTGAANQALAATYAGRELLQQQQAQRERDIETGKSIAQPIFDWLTRDKGGAGGGGGSWSIPGTDIGGGLGGGGETTSDVGGGGLGTTALGKGVTGVGKGIGSAAHAVGHGASKLIGLAASHPVAAAAIGVGVGATLLAKHFVGQGRRAANVLTGEGGMQRAFEDTLKEIDSMNIPDAQKWQHKQEAYQHLVQLGLEHAKKGHNEQKVVRQMFNTISPLFGAQNPLDPGGAGQQAGQQLARGLFG